MVLVLPATSLLPCLHFYRHPPSDRRAQSRRSSLLGHTVTRIWPENQAHWLRLTHAASCPAVALRRWSREDVWPAQRAPGTRGDDVSLATGHATIPHAPSRWRVYTLQQGCSDEGACSKRTPHSLSKRQSHVRGDGPGARNFYPPLSS